MKWNFERYMHAKYINALRIAWATNPGRFQNLFINDHAAGSSSCSLLAAPDMWQYKGNRHTTEIFNDEDKKNGVVSLVTSHYFCYLNRYVVSLNVINIWRSKAVSNTPIPLQPPFSHQSYNTPPTPHPHPIYLTKHVFQYVCFYLDVLLTKT